MLLWAALGFRLIWAAGAVHVAQSMKKQPKACQSLQSGQRHAKVCQIHPSIILYADFTKFIPKFTEFFSDSGSVSTDHKVILF